MDATAAANALATGTFASRVQSQFVSGRCSGVNGTPTFFINGRRYDLTINERVLFATLEDAALANSPN